MPVPSLSVLGKPILFAPSLVISIGLNLFLLSCTRWTQLEQTNLSTGGSRRREASGKPEDDSVTIPQSVHMTTAQPLMASNLSNPSIHPSI